MPTFLDPCGSSANDARTTSRPWGLTGSSARALGIGLLLLGLARIALGAGGDYRVTRRTSDTGLPQNYVRSLLQTRDGYLWLATRGGLARYDGVRFTRYRRANTPELTDDNCVALAEDGEGALWIGTENGLVRLHHHRFTPWLPEPTHSPGTIANGQIRALCASPKGGVWIATTNGLDHYRAGTFTHYTTADGLLANNIRAVFEDSQGAVWVGTELNAHFGGLDWRAPGVSRFESVPGQGTNLPFMVHTFVENPDGLWWGNNDGLHCRSNGIVRDYHMADGLAGEVVCRIAPARGGGLWIVTGERADVQGRRGLHRLRDGRITPIDLASYGIDADMIGVIEDFEGNVWIGTRHDGLVGLQPRVFRAFTARDGLPQANVNSIAADPEGAIWVATDGGLAEIRNDRVQPTPRYEVRGGKVLALIADGPGRLWAGAEDKKLYVFAGAQSDAHTTFNNDRLFFDREFTCLGAGGEGVVWAARTEGTWRLRIRFENGEFAFDGQHSAPNAGFPPGDTQTILQDRSGQVWFGTRGAGLCRIRALPADSPTNFFVAQSADTPIALESPPRTFTTRDGLGSDSIRTLHEDRAGVLWVGTDRGLSRFKQESFSNIGVGQRLMEGVNHILEDDSSHLWLGCDHGVARVRLDHLNAVADGTQLEIDPVVFGEADGMPSSETAARCQPGACKSPDGRLWFPTAEGVAVVDPQSLRLNTVPPPVRIEQVCADGEVIFGGAVADDLRRVGPSHAPVSVREPGAEVRLKPGRARSLEIYYTANTFIAPGNVRFRYRLEGQDKDPQFDDNNRRVASYSNLRPGPYKFRVQARNSHGRWNDTEGTFAFSLAPHFYETWLFYGLCATVVVLIGWGLHRRRVAILTRIHRLEQQHLRDRERSRIARDIHDDIGSRLTQLSYEGELARGHLDPASKARSHLDRLRRTTADVFLALEETVWVVNPKHDSIRGLVTCLRKFGPEYLATADVRCRLDFPDQVPDCPLPAEHRHALRMVVKEALNNTVKHAHATQVVLRLRVENRTLLLSVEDNGRGFDPPDTPPSTPAGSQDTAGAAPPHEPSPPPSPFPSPQPPITAPIQRAGERVPDRAGEGHPRFKGMMHGRKPVEAPHEPPPDRGRPVRSPKREVQGHHAVQKELDASPVRASRLGNGLENMRERILQIGGQFELSSRPGQGTRIAMRLTL